MIKKIIKTYLEFEEIALTDEMKDRMDVIKEYIVNPRNWVNMEDSNNEFSYGGSELLASKRNRLLLLSIRYKDCNYVKTFYVSVLFTVDIVDGTPMLHASFSSDGKEPMTLNKIKQIKEYFFIGEEKIDQLCSQEGVVHLFCKYQKVGNA